MRRSDTARENELLLVPARWVPPWLGHVAAFTAVLTSGPLPVGEDRAPGLHGGVIALALVSAVVVLLRRRLPATTVVATVCLVWASVPLQLFNPGIATAVAIAVFTASRRLSRREALWLVIGAGVLVAAAVGVAVGRGALQFLLLILLFGALGDLVRAHSEQFLAITERAERAEATREALANQRVAEDRLAIARDLHDAVAHQIAVINLHAGVAGSALHDRPDDAEHSLAVIRQASRTVLTQIGDLLATLRDPGSPGTGPAGLAQLDDVLRQFRGHGLDVTVRRLGEARELPPAVDVVALRVIQEALTNAHKHGADHRAHVLIEYLPDRLHVTVTNPVAALATQPTHPGPTADGADAAPVTTGNGLIGARERVESVRGTLRHGRTGTSSWELDVDLPAPVPGSDP